LPAMPGAHHAPNPKHRREAGATQNLPMKSSNRCGEQGPPYERYEKYEKLAESSSPFRLFAFSPQNNYPGHGQDRHRPWTPGAIA
jgi:hypothetical protein